MRGDGRIGGDHLTSSRLDARNKDLQGESSGAAIGGICRLQERGRKSRCEGVDWRSLPLASQEREGQEGIAIFSGTLPICIVDISIFDMVSNTDTLVHGSIPARYTFFIFD